MGRARIAAAVAAAVTALGAPVAHAASPRQSGSIGFTTGTPAAATGITAHFDFVNPADPAGKPYSVSQMIVTGPAGTVTDTTAPPQCHASDPEIYLLGPDACPAESRIGHGLAVTDNGPGANPREGKTPLTHFNNQDEIVGIGVNEQIPAIKTIDRTKLEGTRSTSTFPPFPGFPPPEPYTPVKSLDITIDPYVNAAGEAYKRTPRKCPKVGYWIFTTEFLYRDGTRETVESHSPCVRR
jgi:hypothetical protein